MADAWWAIVLRHNLTHLLCVNKTIVECKNIYHTIPKEELDVHDQDNLEFPFLADRWQLIILSVIAFLLNASELVCLKLRQLKCTTSEYLILSLCFLDLSFSLLTITGITVKLIEEKARIYESESIIVITEQFLWFSVFGSIFHVLAISLERVFAVTCLIEYKVFMEKGNIKICIVLLWVSTIVLQGSISTFQYHNGIEYGLHELSQTANQITGSIILSVGLLLCILNVVMLFKMSRKNILLQGIFVKNRRGSVSKRQSRIESLAFVTCCMVSLGFLLFNFPYAFVMIFYEDPRLRLTVAVESLLMVNSIFNPLIYFWRGYWLRVQRRRSLKRSLSSSQSTEAIFHLTNNYRRSQEVIALNSTNNNIT